jgi:hypothetical protein
MDDNIKTFTTEKGRLGITYMGYCYRFAKRGADGSIQWRCVDSKRCSGRLSTDEDYQNPEFRGQGHTHPPDVNVSVVREVRSTLRKRAATETTPLPTIYREATAKLAGQPAAAALMPAFGRVSSTLYTDRLAMYPPLPASIADIHIPRKFRRTLSGHRFLLATGANNEYFAFGTKDNLKMLCDADDISMDGTFGTAPRLFRQLFTINAFVDDRLLPAVYVLMADKSGAGKILCNNVYLNIAIIILLLYSVRILVIHLLIKLLVCLNI